MGRAQEYALKHDVPHTQRDSPAWVYSQRDFEAGFGAAIKLLEGQEAADYSTWFWDNNKRPPQFDDWSYWLEEKLNEENKP